MRKAFLLSVLAAALLLCADLKTVAAPAQGEVFAALSAQERQWLEENRDSIVLTYEANLPPLELRTGEGGYVGFSADIVHKLETLLGVRFKKLPSYDFNAQLASLQSGETHLCAAIVRTPERERFVSFTGAYISLPLVIITSTSLSGHVGWNELRKRRVGVVPGYAAETIVRGKARGRFTVVSVGSVREGLRDVSFGVLDAFVENLASVSYYIEKDALTNLRVAGATDHSYQMSIGVSRQYPLLYSAVQKALSEISAEDMESSRKKWISLSGGGVLSPEAWGLIKLAGVFTVLLLLSLGAISYYLRRRLSEKVASLRLAQQELLEQTERLGLATEATNAGVWDFYPDTGQAYFSEQWIAMLGYEPGAVEANFAGWVGLIHPEDRVNADNALMGYIDTGGEGLFEAEYRVRQADGSYRWVLGKGRAIAWDQGGIPTRLVGLNMDIQKLKTVQEELRQSEALAQAAFDQTFQLCSLLTTDGLVVNVNRSGLAYSGARQEDVVGRPFWDCSWWPDRLEAEGLLRQAMATVLAGGTFRREVLNIDARRNKTVVDFSLSPLIGAGGVVEFFIVEGRDVTEMRQAEAALKESEEKFRAIFNNAPIGIFRTSFDGRLLEANTALARMHGCRSAAEYLLWARDLGKDRYAHPEDRQRLLDALLENPSGASLSTELRRKDGSTCQGVINAVLHRDEHGVPAFIDGTIEDITDRKQAEEALRQSEEKYRAIFNSMPVGIFRTTVGGLLIDVNPTMARMLGYADSQHLLASTFDLGRDIYQRAEDRHSFINALRASPEGVRMELKFKRLDGTPFYAIVNASLQQGDQGVLALINGTVEDITERKALELRLADQLAFQQALLDTIPYPVFYKGADTRFVGFNNAYEEVFGVRREDLIGKRVLDLEYLPAEDRETYQFEDEAVIGSVGQVQRDMPFLYADGAVHQTLYSVTGFRLADGTSGGLIGVIVDITDLKQTEEALRQSEEKFSRIFEMAPECISFVRLKDSLRIAANAAFETITGYTREEAVGISAQKLCIWDDPERRGEYIARLLADGHVKDFEFLLRRKDGAVRRVVSSAQLVSIAGEQCYVSVIHDITDERKIQELLIQSEKMMSVGSLAAGIAHEINNPLGIVHQAVQNLILRTSPEQKKNLETAAGLGLDMDKLQAYLKARKLDLFLQDIQAAALRASGIIRNMLNFSRRSESKRQTCDLHRIIEQSVFLASSDYDLKKAYDFKRIEIVQDYETGLPACSCTETELEQVLLNLLRNAAQAMAMADPLPQAPRIELRLRAGKGCVRIEVADNGPGMDPETQRKALEPFFTTKPPGVGTGLGLSVSYFIITKGHGGKMWLTSAPGRGTTFFIELPADEQEPGDG